MSFDLILVGDELADMPGLEFVSRIRCRKVRKKIIYISKNCLIEEKFKSESLGIDKYIHLSVSWVDFTILIDRAIGGQNDLCLN